MENTQSRRIAVLQSHRSWQKPAIEDIIKEYADKVDGSAYSSSPFLIKFSVQKVDNTQYNIFKLTNNDDKVLQTKHIMEVIDASQERVLKQYGYNNSKQDVELLKKMIEAIKVDVDSADRQSIPRLEANAEHWDDTARHAYKMTNDKTFSILNPDSRI